MDENEITQRLRDAGDQPVPGEVRATHLSQMHAAVPVVEKPKRFGRLAVAAAAFVGFAVGSTGFAMAGALPAPAQGLAHDVLSVVQVEVPDRKDNRGKCVSAIANDPDLTPQQKKAAKDEQCQKGKPAHAGKGNGGGPPEELMNDGDPCKGPPPWAGKGAKAEKAAQKEAHRAARAGAGCADDDTADAEAETAEDQQERESEALEEQREAEQQAPPAPPEQAPADPGAQGQGGPPAELPAPLAPDAGPDATD
jgi:hypothetical protein